MLSVFEVVLAVDDSPAYVRRTRAVLSAALDLAIAGAFDEGELPTGDIPAWFMAASGSTEAALTEFSRRGRDRYHAAVSEKSWDVQWWLFEFDPDNEFRGWSWWDATQAGARRVRIWADSWGESFFACDELRWLLYTAGAEEVAGPFLADTSEWEREVSVHG